MDYAAKNQQFLAWFWDLASDDRDRRVGAADSILAHVEHAVTNQKGMNEEGNMVIDLDYALKRLIRGLSSSRDSARHGFATCLSALVSSGAVPLEVVMPMIENSTQLRGKMKGSEERDLIFGRLFAYLAVARSGALADSPSAALDIFKRMLDLHSLKGWLREVTSEGLLVLLSVMNTDAAETEAALAALEGAGMLREPMEDWMAWQLQLALGLQSYAAGLKEAGGSAAKTLRSVVHRLLPEKKVCTVDLLLGRLTAVLTGAAAGFPKVHRVWEMLFTCMFDLPNGHEGRLERLGEKQEALLGALMEFIRTHLLVASREKRSLAFRLTVRLAALVPIAHLSAVANKTVLRSMVAARSNKKHALNTQAALAIRDLVACVLPLQEAGTSLNVLEPIEGLQESSDQARLALASCFVEHGSANFDAITGIPAVSTLLVGLDSASALEHVHALVRLVGAACGATTVAVTTEPEAEDADDDQWRAAERSPVATALASLEALTSLAKNRRLSCRGSVCSIVVTIMVKLACFADGELPDAAFVEAPAKKSRSKKVAGAQVAQAREGFVESVASDVEPLLEALKAVCGSDGATYATEVSTAASGKLLTLLSEVGGLSQAQLDAAAGAAKDAEEEPAEGSSMLSQALATAAFLAACGVPAKATTSMEVEGATDVLEAFQGACGAIQQVCAANASAPLSIALCSLLGHASFQLLAANSDLGQTVLDIAAVAPTLVAGLGSDDDAQLEEPLGSLLDACFDLLAQDASAVRGDQLSLKGVASAVKRVWTVVGKDLPVGLGLLENIVSAVVGDDNDDEEEEADEHDHDHDHEEAEASAQSASEEEKEEEDKEEEEEDDEEEEDVLLGEESALNLLASENSDDEDELAQLKGMLPVTQHGEEADAALIHMLEMRKKSRKAGLLDAKRKQMLVRSRAIDMLEAVLARIEIPELLVPLLPPLLTCARKVQTGLTSSLAEGRTFESRLRSVIDQRVCRKKFALSHYGDAETEEGIMEMVSDLCRIVKTDMANASAPLRQLAQRVLMCLTRSISLGDCIGAKVTIGETHRELMAEFFSRKKARVGATLFDETVQRFPDFAVEHYALECATGAATAISPFLRAEACRLLLAVTRRFGAFADPAREAMAAAVPTALQSLTLCVSISEGGEGASVGNAKRLKPALQCIRELCALPICAGKLKELQTMTPSAGAKKGKGKKDKPKAVNITEVLAELERCLRSAGERLPTLLPLLQQSLTAVAAVGGGEVALLPTPVKEAKVAGKKRGADSLEAMEQKLLNDTNSAVAKSEEAEKQAERKASTASWHGQDPDSGKKKSKKSKK